MPTPKPQPSRALKVIPSEYCNIPFPNAVLTNGLIASASGDIVEDVFGGFLTNPTIKIGDIFYCEGDAAGYTVVEIVSDTELRLNYPNLQDTLTTTSSYIVYSGDMNPGCVLYIGNSVETDVTEVKTAGGDVVQFINIPQGSFFPVQVIAVIISDATNIIALW